jgi:hypothetical protein
MRRVYGSSGLCLHCAVWDFIADHAPVDRQTGERQIDGIEVISSLTDVIAELVSGCPAGMRESLLDGIISGLHGKVRDATQGDSRPVMHS